MPQIVFRARHLATMLAPVIDDGCVIVRDGRIVEAGPTHLVRPPRVDVEIDGVLMPGLINAHTHLELTNVPRPPQAGSFVDWVIETIAAQRRDNPAEYQRDRAEGVRQGIEQCLRFGVTCVGDISQNVEVVRPILSRGPIRSVSFGECLGIGERRGRFDSLLEKAMTVTGLEAGETNPERMTMGISPHAPYTVDFAGYAIALLEQSQGYLYTTHLAETPDEEQFLRSHVGPLRDLYDRLGLDPGQPTYFDSAGRTDPIDALGLLCKPYLLLAHVNYCADWQMEVLSEFRWPSVVWCPRTHNYFGHPPHRWKEMLARDINVCIGTDSCASSGDLNIVDDLRLLHASEPGVAADQLWAMVTRDAERALRWGWDFAFEHDREAWSESTHRSIGVIAPGALADFTAFATRSEDPLREILDDRAMMPSGVWIAGMAID